MAHFTKLPSGLWRAQVARRGVRLSQTFKTKGAAQQWAVAQEAEILDGKAHRWPNKTLDQAMTRYEAEVTPNKRAQRYEQIAFGVMRKFHGDLCAKHLHAITPADIAAWRDKTLQRVTGSTVQRYAGLFRNVWTIARKEWGWVGESPWSDVRLPAHNPPREKLLTWQEIRKQLRRLGYHSKIDPITKTQEVGLAWLIALRTGMRAGEIMGLAGADVDLDTRVVRLAHHKTIHITRKPRFVPITHQAARLLARVAKPGPLWAVSSKSLDALFRKARGQAGLDGFTFHDSRATALTMLSKRVDVLTLARISGHVDLRQLLSTYYRESDQAIAQRLSPMSARPAGSRPATSD